MVEGKMAMMMHSQPLQQKTKFLSFRIAIPVCGTWRLRT